MLKIKETLTLNRPAYVGMCIHLSKTLMYDFHYNCIKQKYGNKAKLLFTDTGGLSYEKKLKMCINTFGKKDKFDNSEYPENSPYFDKTNKKGIGKFEDDGYGIPLVEFIGLGSKMCFYIKDNHKGGKTAKGIRKNVIRKNANMKTMK